MVLGRKIKVFPKGAKCKGGVIGITQIKGKLLVDMEMAERLAHPTEWVFVDKANPDNQLVVPYMFAIHVETNGFPIYKPMPITNEDEFDDDLDEEAPVRQSSTTHHVQNIEAQTMFR